MTNIASYYQINAETLRRHYKHKVSGFRQWEQLLHAEEYLIYPENMTSKISIDKVSLSKGELYTIVTNKNTKSKNRGSLIAIINGTEAKTIQSVLEKIPLESRDKVQEITLDMAPNMALAARNSFQYSVPVVDRFHIVKLVIEGMQHLRTKLRWQALELENREIKKSKLEKRKYQAEILRNGDTTKEILVRSKYLLYKFEENWTSNQKKRAEVLFEKYPLLKVAYRLVCSFRSIYKSIHKEDAKRKFYDWKQKIIAAKIEEFNTVVNSIEHHLPGILNFFNNKKTNANAESFNSKIKGFRANLRGVSDVKFFLFRLRNLFA